MLINFKTIPAICSYLDPVLSINNGLSIKGQIKQKDLPYVCRVKLYEKNTSRLISEVLTDQEGFYEFNHLSKKIFTIIAHDPSNKFNAVIQDNIIPK